MSSMLDGLFENKDIQDNELISILETEKYDRLLFEAASEVRQRAYGREVYIRGLIEISNYCKNNCYYCGIRSSNKEAARYRLSQKEIIACCAKGHALGFRSFVLQGGEDFYFTDEKICKIVAAIKEQYDDSAVTLSLGEHSRESYQAFFDAGADRYLLRHESAANKHYRMIHPGGMSLASRKKCLYALKEIGYQVGSGFMVGLPYQTTANLVEDIRFLQDLKPDMIGIGPYLTHHCTPFKDFPNGSLKLTLRLVAILRLLFPYALIPATTALATIAPNGRELGLLAGANVVMPNLSPVQTRKLYELYNNKLHSGEEAAESLEALKQLVSSCGYEVVVSRGDAKVAEE